MSARNQVINPSVFVLLLASFAAVHGDDEHADNCDCKPIPKTAEARNALNYTQHGYGMGCGSYAWNDALGNPVSWCYIHGNTSNCNLAIKSDEIPGNFYKRCDSCNCRKKWSKNNVWHEACGPWEGHDPWCMIEGYSGKEHGECSDGMQFDDEYNHQYWKYCASCGCLNGWVEVQDDMVAKDATKVHHGCAETGHTNAWCYVQGGCYNSQPSSYPKESREYLDCHEYDCQKHWSWWPGGEKHFYDGNSTNAVAKGFVHHSGCADGWCYIQGDGGYPGRPSEEYSKWVDNKYWKNCDACDCRQTFQDSNPKYDHKTHHGCAHTGTWTENCDLGEECDKTWCFVEGDCESGGASSNKNESMHWKQCDQCQCYATWDYQLNSSEFTLQNNCDGTSDWDLGETHWCYVQGVMCNKEPDPSSFKDEDRFWRECVREDESCKAAKMAFKDSGCCEHPNNPEHLFDVTKMGKGRRLAGGRGRQDADEYSLNKHIADVLRAAKAKGQDVGHLAKKISSAVERRAVNV